MKLEQLPEEFEHARPVLQTIEQAGYEAYFVGGSVRDTILGKAIHDVDIATSAYPDEIKHLFKRTVDTGIEHGTVMILDHGTGYETTTFRSESTYTDFRRPDQVTFVRSLAEDLKRRDFTINALAMRENGEVIDLFDGLTDLQNNQIRAVGDAQERFHEDALRMMRAVRFASQLDFTIVPDTLDAITAHAQLLTKIAVERTQVELLKLLQGKTPQRGLTDLMATGLWQYCPHFAPHEVALKELTTQLVHGVSSETAAWTLLVTKFGLETAAITPFMKHWKTANQTINAVQTTSKTATLLLQGGLNAWQLYQCGADLMPIANEVAVILGAPDRLASLTTQLAALPIQHKKELAVTGKDLMQAGIQPGPQLGAILGDLEYGVVTGAVANTHDALVAQATA
ncbi:CCA tRNA nucleotidyltransferase [Levilactobacillus parabrevis]|uniref:CCA-adding enzyme n=1 Tax=Levilactobacillus parabrevis ATCC 53295 TaxID=1267003 RepID=A0A0R1GXN3_9LACO|nr:CCA tRNA nucleotidyltransferase [Levilactobacillus parabrevis]KRK38910.1 tRNA nucleotidyltransferase poly(A) polymerase [Levilactobacillus parabrevis ATCC 53295]KRO06638.1 tRNA nucleotidyltransferase poly(A) polymerase [Levilactobacillus parabrevis]